YERTIVTVAGYCGGDVELEMFIAGVGVPLAKIPFEPARAKIWAGHSPFDGVIDAKRADSFRPRFEDAVLHHLRVVLGQSRWKICDEFSEHPFPAFGEICSDAANAKPFRMHASPADRFNDRERALTIIECVEHR